MWSIRYNLGSVRETKSKGVTKNLGRGEIKIPKSSQEIVQSGVYNDV